MRAKRGKWGWPRLHFSTAVILFLAGSVGLGIQFIRYQAVNTFRLNTGSTALLLMGGDDRPHLKMEDGFHPEYAFGLPFTALITGVHYEDSGKSANLRSHGHAWNYKAVAGNAVAVLGALGVIAFFLERRIRRRTLNPSPDNV